MIAWCLAALLSVAHAQETITLDLVLEGLDTRQPYLEAAEAEVDAARGRRLAAVGLFDPTLDADGLLVRGYQNYEIADAGIEGKTPIGWSYEAGYIRGTGEVPTYDSYYATGDDGEIGGKVKLPLLQGFLFGKERLALWDTALGLQGAEAQAEWTQAWLRAKAAGSWWKWVAYGEMLLVTERRRDLAVERVDGLRRQVETGASAEIDLLDNERALQERHAEVTEAERMLTVAAQELSLWLREPGGARVVPNRSQLPALPEASTPLESDAVRPDLAAAELEVRRAEMKRRSARNALLPELTVGVQGFYDLADDKAEAKAAVALTVPLALREGRGRAQEASAMVVAKEAKRRQLADAIAADLRSAEASVVAARQAAASMAIAAQRADRVRILETRNFELGGGDIFKLLYREDVWAKAELDRIKTRMALGLAVVELELVRGVR